MIPIYIIKCYNCGEWIERCQKRKSGICFKCKKKARKKRYLEKKKELALLTNK